MAQHYTACDDGGIYSQKVGSYQANAFGLYDMHGNVWEWLADCYAPYASNSKNRICEKRVIRGGSFQSPAHNTRLSNRDSLKPSQRSSQLGFRVVRDL